MGAEQRRPFSEYLAAAGGEYDAALDAYLGDIAAAAPPLSDESLAKLTFLLRDRKGSRSRLSP
jgi:hypothetical protein